MNKSLIFTIIFGLLISSNLRAETPLSFDESQQKIKSTLDKINNSQNPDIPYFDNPNPVVKELDPVKHQVPNIKIDYKKPDEQVTDPLIIAKRYEQQNKYKPLVNDESVLMIFVSFSMPESSLKRIAIESKKINAVLVLRGFKDNSLKETTKAFADLASLGAKAHIHPDLFNKYGVFDVPTYVLTDNKTPIDNSCDSEKLLCGNNYLAVKGDISLDLVLEEFEAKKENPLSKFATEKLNIIRNN